MGGGGVRFKSLNDEENFIRNKICVVLCTYHHYFFPQLINWMANIPVIINEINQNKNINSCYQKQISDVKEKNLKITVSVKF